MYLQFMSKVMKKYIRRWGVWKIKGKKDIDEQKEVALDCTSLLVNEEGTCQWVWMMNFDCSLYICCEIKKFTSLESCNGGLVTKPKDEKKKFKDIG